MRLIERRRCRYWSRRLKIPSPCEFDAGCNIWEMEVRVRWCLMAWWDKAQNCAAMLWINERERCIVAIKFIVASLTAHIFHCLQRLLNSLLR